MGKMSLYIGIYTHIHILVYKDIQETNTNINNKRQNPANPKTATTKQKTHNRHALYG